MTPMPTTIAEPLSHPESTSGNHGAGRWVCTQFATGKKPSTVPKMAKATASHRESRRVDRRCLVTCEHLSEEGHAAKAESSPFRQRPRETLRLGRPCVLGGNASIALDFYNEVL